jgi:hypothetical protein
MGETSIDEKTVCDASGRIGNYIDPATNKEVKIIGTLQPKKIKNSDIDDPYVFYTKDTDTGAMIDVILVLPVGGAQSGFYRFPRVGEKVLVAIGGNTGNYLLGYVPNESALQHSILPCLPEEVKMSDAAEAAKTKQSTGGSLTAAELKTLDDETIRTAVFVKEVNKLQTDQGMILRYQQTGKEMAQNGEEYSEIGFYHGATQWKPSVAGDYVEMAKDNKGESTGIPKIDRVSIRSTGDIRSDAKNYYEIKAKRLEILAGLDSRDHTKTDLPLGDNQGDDSNLYTGDAHIRAKNRVVIKADDEIVLQVGRSVVRISDAGITLSSKKVKGNFSNPWNTVLSLTPRDGINMFGQQVNMTGAFGFSLIDSMGGSLSSLAGMVRLIGKDVKLNTITTLGYVIKQVAMSSKFATSIDAMRSGMLKRLQGDVNTGYDNARTISAAILDIATPIAIAIADIIAGKDDDPEDADPFSLYLVMLDVLMKVNAASCTVLAEKMRTKQQLHDNIRDQINLAQMVVDYGLLIISSVLFVAKAGVAITHRAVIQLRSTAHIEQNSLTRKIMGTEGEDAAAPLAGYVNAATEAAKKVAKAHDTAAKIAIVASVLAGATVGTLAYGIGEEETKWTIGSRWDAIAEADQAVRDALMEL